jgi:hypothetical protein
MRTACLVAMLSAALSFGSGCKTYPPFVIYKPELTEYGPFSSPPKELWETSRGVLADLGYTFSVVDRETWYAQTHWNYYGSDLSRESNRYRVEMELDLRGPGETYLLLLVETESNSATDPANPSEADWTYYGRDDDAQDEIVYRTRKKLGESGQEERRKNEEAPK